MRGHVEHRVVKEFAGAVALAAVGYGDEREHQTGVHVLAAVGHGAPLGDLLGFEKSVINAF